MKNNFTILNGDSLELLKQQPDNSIDSVITDPPYGIGFMGKDWDKPENIAFNPEFWSEVLRVLKPGGHLLAFSASRTYHRMTIAIEDSGFEIRDQIMWLYGSGFPKAQDLSKMIDKKIGAEEGEKWEGWKSALKPAHEPIVMARKPFKGTLVDNVLENEVGALNIAESRVGGEVMKAQPSGKTSRAYQSEATTTAGGKGENQVGRFPANVIHDNSQEVIDSFPTTKSSKGKPFKKEDHSNPSVNTNFGRGNYDGGYGDSGSAARFFYGAKCSSVDRSEGLDTNQINTGEFKGGKVLEEFRNQEHKNDGLLVNNHPTVKPTSLMTYLVRLVTPKGGKVLDPFNGSGSTGKAIAYLNKTEDKNYSYLGMELDQYYIDISRKRIEYTLNNKIWLEKKEFK